MLEQDLREKLEPLVRVNQLIVGGLMASVVFLTIMLVIVFSSERGDKVDDAETPIVAYVAAGVAVVACIARLTVGPLVARNATAPSQGATTGVLNEIDDPVVSKAAVGWQTSNIVRNALTEGAALFNAVAYMVHGDPISLGIVGFLLAWMAIGFPRMPQLEQHISDRRQEAELEAN